VNHPPISVVLVTYNSERHLAECLSSVTWADELVVVDLQSNDRTLEIARSFGCRVLSHAWVAIVEMVRQEAIGECKYEWILMLDPDEIVPPALAERMRAIAASGEADAVSIPWKNYIFGQWMRYSGWNGDRHTRFFRKGTVHYPKDVHSGERTDGRILRLPDEEPYYIIHLNYDTVEQFVEKLNRYTTLEVEKLAGQPNQNNVGEMVRAPFREFRRRYFDELGFRDGLQGLAACELMAFYWAVVSLKKAERDGWVVPAGWPQTLADVRLGLWSGMLDLLVAMERTADNRLQRVVVRLVRGTVGLVRRLRARSARLKGRVAE